MLRLEQHKECSCSTYISTANFQLNSNETKVLMFRKILGQSTFNKVCLTQLIRKRMCWICGLDWSSLSTVAIIEFYEGLWSEKFNFPLYWSLIEILIEYSLRDRQFFLTLCYFYAFKYDFESWRCQRTGSEKIFDHWVTFTLWPVSRYGATVCTNFFITNSNFN